VNTRFPLLLLCFFLSGLAALVYETAWTREFAFVFGTSDLAVSAVLAGYMAGLALGAALAARLAPRITRPVLAYGVLELGIALCALALPLAIDASRWLYVAVFGGAADLPDAGGLATALFYLACSFAILVAPTAMMGATLPLLARHAVRETRQIGSRVGVLYAANTAGAVVGVLLGGFVLLPELGLRATIATAAGVNALVFVTAWQLARGGPLAGDAPAEATPAAELEVGRARWILPLLAISGFCSFSYEVLWVRLLGQIVGGGLHAFATMLASFLVGIALGAALASRIASSPRRAATCFTAAQLGTAALSVAAFAVVDRLPALSDALQARGFDKLWADTVISMATLFPAALCIGATFPCAVRLLARRREDAGPASAKAYAWNTAGSIAGSIAAAFFLIPVLGFEGTITLCAGANLALAAAGALLFEPRRIALLAAAAAGAIALAVHPPATPWGLLRASSMGDGVSARAWGKVAYFGIGRSSTVLVVDQRQSFALRTNGLPESSMLRRGTTWHNASPVTRWLTALPVFARPEARSMLVIGFGGGMLLEVVPDSVERIDVVELEPKVIEANQKIAAERWRDPLSDPRVHIHLNDARNALLLTNQRFDAIVSQPSHPWAGGAAHLYTREFFQRVEDRLSDRGVFLQWIGLPFIDEELLRSLLASLADVFDYVSAYQPPPGGSILFLASNAPIEPLESAARAIAQSPEDAKLLGIVAPEDVVASLLLDDPAVRALAAGAPANRDGHNRLEDRSGRLGNAALDSKKLSELIAPFPSISCARSTRPSAPRASRLALRIRWTGWWRRRSSKSPRASAWGRSGSCARRWSSPRSTRRVDPRCCAWRATRWSRVSDPRRSSPRRSHRPSTRSRARCARARIRPARSCSRSTRSSPRSRCGIRSVRTPRACARSRGSRPATRRGSAKPCRSSSPRWAISPTRARCSCAPKCSQRPTSTRPCSRRYRTSRSAWRRRARSSCAARSCAGRACWRARRRPATRSSSGSATACCGSTASIRVGSELLCEAASQSPDRNPEQHGCAASNSPVRHGSGMNI